MTTPPTLLPFTIRRFDGFAFLSNDLGEIAFLDDADAGRFLAGHAPADGDKLEELRRKGFLAGGMSHDAYAERFWSRRSFLDLGPILHGLVLTERCNLGCQVLPLFGRRHAAERHRHVGVDR